MWHIPAKPENIHFGRWVWKAVLTYTSLHVPQWLRTEDVAAAAAFWDVHNRKHSLTDTQTRADNSQLPFDGVAGLDKKSRFFYFFLFTSWFLLIGREAYLVKGIVFLFERGSFITHHSLWFIHFWLISNNFLLLLSVDVFLRFAQLPRLIINK